MKNMKEKGLVNPIVVPLVMSVILVLVLGFTTFKYYNDYSKQKNEVDSIVAQAVSEAEEAQAEKLGAEHAEALKNPYETYTAPAQFNAVAVTYPRTWSSYVIESDSGNTALEGFFHPGTVPDTKGDDKFALKITLERGDYSEEVEDYQKAVEDGELKAQAITINEVKGIRLQGILDRDVNGIMVILPVRDKVLKVWTEANTFADDFNKVIVKNLSFDR